MMAFDKVLDEKNRLWSLPLLAGFAGLLLFQFRDGSLLSLRTAFEVSVAGGIGFLGAALWTLVQDWKAGLPKTLSRAHQQAKLELQERNLGTLKTELRSLEAGLQDYLAAKKQEGKKVHNTLLDLNNDISLVKAKDPLGQLQPQLKAIADKFGELAGVRAVVANLSSKIRQVESLTQKVQKSDFAFEGDNREDNRETVKIVHKASVGAQESQATLQKLQHDMETRFESQLQQGVTRLIENTDNDQIAKILNEELGKRLETIERRFTKVSRTITDLHGKFESLRFAGTTDEGIPSIYRSVQGIDMKAPENALKSGCLLKLFNANKSIRQAIAA